MAQLSYDARLTSNPPPTAVDFRDTDFFRIHASGSSNALPSPTTIRALLPGCNSGSVVLNDLGLFVKFGAYHKVSIEEAQTIQALRRTFSNKELPIPELVGWRRTGDVNFIYMSLVPGVTLEACWPTLSEQERALISQQLKRMVESLRTLKQRSTRRFIGSISQSQIQDIFFHADAKAGPFCSVRDFNDRFQFWAMSWLPVAQRPPDPLRALLPDTSEVCFSHADLHFDNILISGPPGSRSVAAVVDWGMSGWYPEYWEYCKMLLLTGHHERWSDDWLPRVLKPYDEEYDAFVNYWQWRGIP
nr:hypothetical protein CFP56_02719 [Quercus suber]